MSGIRDVGGPDFGAAQKLNQMPNGHATFVAKRTGSQTLPFDRQATAIFLRAQGVNVNTFFDVIRHYAQDVTDDDVVFQTPAFIAQVKSADEQYQSTISPFLEGLLEEPLSPLAHDLHTDLLTLSRRINDIDFIDGPDFLYSIPEIRDWFLHADPLNEMNRIMTGVIVNTFLDQNQELDLVANSIIRANVYASVVKRLVNDIYARALLPEKILESSPQDWRHHFIKEYFAQMPPLDKFPEEELITNYSAYIPEHFFTAAIFCHAKSTPLSQENLDALLLASEIDGFFRPGTKRVVDPNTPESQRIVDRAGDAGAQLVSRLKKVSSKLETHWLERLAYSLVFVEQLKADIDSPKKTHREFVGQTDEQAMTLLQIQLLQISGMGSLAGDKLDSVSALVLATEEFLNRLFAVNDQARETGASPVLSKGEIKGTIHEVIWYLDMSIMLRLQGETNVGLRPAAAREDYPTAGSDLSLRRSFDFVLYQDHTCPVYVQLKSSAGKRTWQKEYHPAITVVEEENFMLVDRRALGAHLKLISDYVKAGSPMEGELADKMRSKLLPTVSSTYDLFSQRREQGIPRIHTLDTKSYAAIGV